MDINTKTSIWSERYKPQHVPDVILPTEISNQIQEFIKSGNMPNLGFWSPEPGLGKSSTANAIIHDLGCEALWINASLENGIDLLRSKIATFASQQTFSDSCNFKVVVMDECDNFSQSGQSAFRSFIDEFSTNCRFIFTGNYKEKVIEPLLSRLVNYDFNNFKGADIIEQVYNRLIYILHNEGIEYNPKDVKLIIKQQYPKIRDMVSSLQKYSYDGKLVIKESDLNDQGKFDAIINNVISKNFGDMLIKVNSLTSPEGMYSYLYKHGVKYFSREKYPNVVITLAKYQAMNSQVRDKHLNLAACLTELMML